MSARTVAVASLALLAGLLGASTVAAESAFTGAASAVAWRPVGPGGGAPGAPLVDPLVPGRLYSIWTFGFAYELYRRDPGATTWLPASQGVPHGIRALTFHPTRPGSLWAANNYPLEIYRSTDAGAHWVRTFQGQDHQPFGLWTVRSGSRVVLFGWFGTTPQSARLFRSLDEGRTWIQVADALGPAAVPAGTNATVFALGSDRQDVLESRDAGATWTRRGRLPRPVFGNSPGLLALLGGRVLFAWDQEFELQRSTDRGATWRRAGPENSGSALVVTASGGLFTALLDAVYESLDVGVTWRRRTDFPRGSFSLAAGPASPPLPSLYSLSIQASSLFESRNQGRSWTRIPVTGVQMFALQDFAWHPRDARLEAMVRSETMADGESRVRLLSSRDGGATWGSAPLTSFAFDPVDPSRLYGASEQGVFVSRQGGEWTRLRDAAATTLAHTGSALLAGRCGISRSLDGGLHWTEVLPCQIPVAGLPNGVAALPRRLLVHPTHPAVVWAEVTETFNQEDGQLEEVDRLYASGDGGATWERRAELHPRIALAPGRPNTVWDFGTVPRRSDDRGLTWTRIFVPGEIHDLAVDPFDADRIFAVGEGVALVSRDNGASWSSAFSMNELAPWGSSRQLLARIFLDPTRAGRLAVAPPLGLLLRSAPVS